MSSITMVLNLRLEYEGYIGSIEINDYELTASYFGKVLYKRNCWNGLDPVNEVIRYYGGMNNRVLEGINQLQDSFIHTINELQK